MVKISLCMIVKDEESVLSRCLDKVKDCVDEIVIVDTGSTDKTVEIAKKYTDKIYRFEWENDFSKARNYAFSLGTGDYLLWLDADDVIPKESARLLPKLKDELFSNGYDGAVCPYEIYSDGKSVLKFNRLRIVKNGAFLWKGVVHECMERHGKLFNADFTVRHQKSDKPRGSRNLDIYRDYIRKGGKLNARDEFYYGRELYYNGFFVEAQALLKRAVENAETWFVNKIEACKYLAFCALAQGDTQGALGALYDSFRYGEPRAGILCEIGKIYGDSGDFSSSAFWYESALSARDHSADGDFEDPRDRTSRPAIELTYVYFRLNDIKKSRARHDLAVRYAPDDPSVKYNQAYFDSLEKGSSGS